MNAEVIQDALQQIDNVKELVLDLSGVRRIDPASLQAMEQLASKARQNAATVTLRCVPVDVYKVLKLAKLADQFSFLN